MKPNRQILLKIIAIVFSLSLYSCNKNEIQVVQLNISGILTDVDDQSPIYGARIDFYRAGSRLQNSGFSNGEGHYDFTIAISGKESNLCPNSFWCHLFVYKSGYVSMEVEASSDPIQVINIEMQKM